MEVTDAAILVDSISADESAWADCPVTGSFVMDIAERTELPGPLSVCIEHIVRSHVTDLLQKVAQHDARFEGKLIPSGSFYEGTKVTHPNEFDYMYELSCFPPDSVLPKHVLPPIYRPTQEEIPHRGYFTLEVNRPSNESAANMASNEPREVIDADDIFHAFFEYLETAARGDVQHNPEDRTLSVTTVKRNGPALTLSFTLNQTVFLKKLKSPHASHSKGLKVALGALKPGEIRNFNSCIKVDIVLAIPLLTADLKLEEGHIETMFVKEDDTEILHLVPSGNCWKLSVAKQESRMIRSLTGVNWRPQETVIVGGEHISSNDHQNDLNVNVTDNDEGVSSDLTGHSAVEMHFFSEWDKNTHSQPLCERTGAQVCRRSCLIAMKHLRDKHESSDPMKKPILPTYPLKVAFLQECREHPSDEDWMKDRLGGRVYNMLVKIDTQSRDGSLTGCFLPNVPVLKSPSYNISRQVSSIKGNLTKIFRSYQLYSGISMPACILGLLAVGYILYASIGSAILVCCNPSERATSTNRRIQKCSYINSTYMCSKVHLPDKDVLDGNLGFAFVCFIGQNLWYFIVALSRLITQKCRRRRILDFYCIPMRYQLLPALALLLAILIVTIVGAKHLDMMLILVASLEGIYLVYEMTCLISICLLRKRKKSISECFRPRRRWSRLCVKRPVEPYFEYISKFA